MAWYDWPLLLLILVGLIILLWLAWMAEDTRQP